MYFDGTKIAQKKLNIQQKKHKKLNFIYFNYLYFINIYIIKLIN
jgi:hypothetical protein